MFEALKVEDLPDDQDDDIGKPPKLTSENTRGEPQQYVLESDVEDDALIFFAFFQDVIRVRGYIRSLWKDYREGRLDLMAAAVTTDTAFSLLKNSCGEVAGLLSSDESFTTMYGTVMLYYKEASQQAKDGISEGFCLQTFDMLRTCLEGFNMAPERSSL